MKITKQYIWGYLPLCSCLITKESYNWWITRRKWGFRHQISKEKDLKISVANIWKHLGEFHRRARWLWNFASWRTTFRSQRFATKGWFRIPQNWPSTWCDRLPMALTSSFQIWIMHHLKHCISDFSSFETKYNVHKLSSKKCSKSVQQLLSSWILHVRFLSLFLFLTFMICFWQRIIKLQSFGSSC